MMIDKAVLTCIIERTSLLQTERKHLSSLNLALLLVHDLLLGGGIQAGDGPIKQAVKRHKTRLQAELVRLKISKGVSRNEDLAIQPDSRAGKIPRYARVNENLWTMEDATKYLEEELFARCSNLSPEVGQYAIDTHIPNLLIFNPASNIHQTEAYLSGKLILQDKASCMPAIILNSSFSDNTEVIDATSAPGNKTSHLSALMRNKGKLFAFERDKYRFKILTKMLRKAGCKNAHPINTDFLTVDPKDSEYAKVSHILLDPSCSGSGIVNRLDHLLESEQDTGDDSQERLNKLAGFQLSMILHAMEFPAVTRIVYSTCSIHAVENELVVRNVLKSDIAQRLNFKLAGRSEVLPTWPRRGLPEHLQLDAEHVLRCSPGEDSTNGFFVSMFIRKESVQNGTTIAIETTSKRERGEEVLGRQSKKRRKKRLG